MLGDDGENMEENTGMIQEAVTENQDSPNNEVSLTEPQLSFADTLHFAQEYMRRVCGFGSSGDFRRITVSFQNRVANRCAVICNDFQKLVRLGPTIFTVVRV